MSCQKCNKEAYIHIEGIGDFCIDCYNAWVEEIVDETDIFDYPKNIVIEDTYDGKKHFFNIRHINFIEYYIFEAIEEPEGYELKHIFYPGDNIENMLKVLTQKISDTISSKTLFPDNTLKDKGNIFIQRSKDDKLEFVIDGKRYSMDEFA